MMDGRGYGCMNAPEDGDAFDHRNWKTYQTAAGIMEECLFGCSFGIWRLHSRGQVSRAFCGTKLFLLILTSMLLVHDMYSNAQKTLSNCSWTIVAHIKLAVMLVSDLKAQNPL